VVGKNRKILKALHNLRPFIAHTTNETKHKWEAEKKPDWCA
jgi:hypothetical protein